MKAEKEERKIHASLTVEAALVLPVFIYAAIAFIYFLQIVLLQEKLQEAITQTGYFSAKYAYVYEYLLHYEDTQEFADEDGSSMAADMDVITARMIDSAFYKTKLRDYLDTEEINRSCIKNGFTGIHTYLSSYMTEDEAIDVVVNYEIKLPLLFIRLNDIQMVQRVRMRGWSGHRVEAKGSSEDGSAEEEADKDERTVYITENGTVYHLNRDCSHLRLSVHMVQFSLIEGLRNESGGRYKKCSLCGKSGLSDQENVYITDSGDRYHCDLGCSGLKRTVIEIPLSQAAGRRPCQRCGNGG